MAGVNAMWVKICANTNLEDARMAAEMGADALGFVFAASKRRVTAEEVRAITAELPEVGPERVGVFDGQDATEMVRAVRLAGLSGVQMHGRTDAEMVERLAGELGPGVTLIQTVSWSVGGEKREAADEVAEQMRVVEGMPAIGRVLIDSRVGTVSGGTGVPFGWEDAAVVLAGCRGRAGLIVAGGLRPENVAEAMRALDPWGVDVATGVEVRPGLKDREKLREFLARARGGDVLGS